MKIQTLSATMSEKNTVKCARRFRHSFLTSFFAISKKAPRKKFERKTWESSLESLEDTSTFECELSISYSTAMPFNLAYRSHWVASDKHTRSTRDLIKVNHNLKFHYDVRVIHKKPFKSLPLSVQNR